MEIHQCLVKEIDGLNNEKELEEFRVRNLLVSFRSIREQCTQNDLNLIDRLRIEVKGNSFRNVFVYMKWLSFLHEAMQVSRTATALEGVIHILRRMGTPHSASCRYEGYVVERLMRPYRQYLQKLGEVMINRRRGPSPLKSGRESTSSHLAFCEYNLMLFASRQFSGVGEFRGFFSNYYPCLNAYTCLLSRDMAKIYKRVRLAFDRGSLNNVTYLQIEQLGCTITLFGGFDSTDRFHSWLWASTDDKSERIESPREESESYKEEEQSSKLALLKEDWGDAISHRSGV